ncbi:AraC family transcriptional regulator [Mesorhizobium xinjiangense]|uniref:AraC family transcriptional regulator n=1 Tax=Mesorhizobium xinjiangense TaxID=2678685 RepID=UPI0012ED912F|nr:AraC family transcriptional regulator [Mesorhizobium xinjiangense]
MQQKTAFLESLHYVPAPGWSSTAFSVLRAGKVAAAPDYCIARTAHPGQDILFCLSGAGTVETLGDRIEVKPGHLVWIANEAPHMHAANGHDPWTLLWFRLDGPNPARLREKLFGEDPSHTRFAENANPAPWFERLFVAMRSRDVGLDLRLNHLVAEFLTILDRNLAGRAREELPPPLAALVGAMRANLRLGWSAAEISAVTGLGQSQTRRLFRRHLRTSPRQWLIRERLTQAQAMLVQTSAPLAEIAELCGFCDVYHLSRDFKRSVGAAPSSWRRNELGSAK